MTSPLEASVTAWIDGLKHGDDEAARQLWQRYFQQLLHVAGRRLRGAPRRVVDEEDVAVSAFQSLCAGAAAGRFEQLHGRDDLWRLLVAITGMKAVDQIRRQTSQKRGGGQVRGDSATPAHDGQAGGFQQLAGAEPTPEFLALVDEQQRRLFAGLRDDTLRHIARLRLEGYSNEEIAAQLHISLRSVERKLQLIRQAWSEELGL